MRRIRRTRTAPTSPSRLANFLFSSGSERFVPGEMARGARRSARKKYKVRFISLRVTLAPSDVFPPAAFPSRPSASGAGSDLHHGAWHRPPLYPSRLQDAPPARSSRALPLGCASSGGLDSAVRSSHLEEAAPSEGRLVAADDGRGEANDIGQTWVHSEGGDWREKRRVEECRARCVKQLDALARVDF